MGQYGSVHNAIAKHDRTFNLTYLIGEYAHFHQEEHFIHFINGSLNVYNLENDAISSYCGPLHVIASVGYCD